MESLESKLDRLTPEQRREIVDFLLHRNEPLPSPQNVTVQAPPFLKTVPPPLTSEPPESLPVTGGESTRRIVIRLPAPMDSGDEEPEPAIQEIGGGDPVTGDYLDYGRFEERPPSPASDAVKRVKENISTKQESGKEKQILDWID